MTAAALVLGLAALIGIGVPAVDNARRWWVANERRTDALIASALNPDRSTR